MKHQLRRNQRATARLFNDEPAAGAGFIVICEKVAPLPHDNLATAVGQL